MTSTRKEKIFAVAGRAIIIYIIFFFLVSSQLPLPSPEAVAKRYNHNSALYAAYGNGYAVVFYIDQSSNTTLWASPCKKVNVFGKTEWVNYSNTANLSLVGFDEKFYTPVVQGREYFRKQRLYIRNRSL